MTGTGRTHGAIVIISGPSGSGKTTIVRRILEEDPELVWSVSATTRAPREGEVDGRDYWFLSREEFERRIRRGYFVEHAESYGELYGTPEGPLREALDAGRVILLDIDVQGARQVRPKFPETVLVFLRPPDIGTLESRLEKRHSETEAQFRLRLGRARTELECADEYDHVIVNDDLEAAVKTLRHLIRRIKENRSVERR